MFYSRYSITEQRTECLDFSDPYYKTNIAIAIKKNSGHTHEDFNNGTLTIGTQQGITSVDEFTISSYLPTWPNLTILNTIDINEYYGTALKKGNTQLKTLLEK